MRDVRTGPIGVLLAASLCLACSTAPAEASTGPERAAPLSTPTADGPAAPAAGDAQAAEACAVVTFTGSEPFTSNRFLFFTFDQPAGWRHEPASDGQPGHGYVHPPANDRLGIEVRAHPGAGQPPGTDAHAQGLDEGARAARGTAASQCPPSGTRSPRRRRRRWAWCSRNEGADYDVVVNFHAPKGCGVTQVEALRTLVARSLKPSPSTTFAPQR